MPIPEIRAHPVRPAQRECGLAGACGPGEDRDRAVAGFVQLRKFGVASDETPVLPGQLRGNSGWFRFVRCVEHDVEGPLQTGPWVDAQLVGEAGSRVVVDLERLGLPIRLVQA